MPNDSKADLLHTINRRLRHVLSDIAQQNPNGQLILLGMIQRGELRNQRQLRIRDERRKGPDFPTPEYIDGLRRSLERGPIPIVQCLYDWACARQHDWACACQPDVVDQFVDTLKELPAKKLQIVADHLKLKPAGRPGKTLAEEDPADIDYWLRVTVKLDQHVKPGKAHCAVARDLGDKRTSIWNLKKRYERFESRHGPLLRPYLQHPLLRRFVRN